MKKLITRLFISVFAPGASRKNGNLRPPHPAVSNNGSLTGIISPAGAASYVWAEDTLTGENQKYIAKADPLTGQFTIKHLPAGNYALTFTTAGAYIAPAPKEVTITKNYNAHAGTFTFIRSVLLFKNGDKSMCTVPGTATYTDNNFKLISIDGKLTISLTNVTGPCIYLCSRTTDNYIILISDSSPSTVWSTKQNSGDAMVEITCIDPLSRTISGIFSGTAAPHSGNSIPKNLLLTEGKFTAAYYSVEQLSA